MCLTTKQGTYVGVQISSSRGCHLLQAQMVYGLIDTCATQSFWTRHIFCRYRQKYPWPTWVEWCSSSPNWVVSGPMVRNQPRQCTSPRFHLPAGCRIWNTDIHFFISHACNCGGPGLTQIGSHLLIGLAKAHSSSGCCLGQVPTVSSVQLVWVEKLAHKHTPYYVRLTC